ncbi:Tom37 C-terminal domain-containing protein [Lineolata rhizophorae]|uniref:Tom37 C-terminal domain-containing protein n=1 Tax=Lineolata rhizophorae TaxID=578093 RepID=A0A6A6NR75_9PEZI|nr:Tom37 C-terminal domain-containing protein [Lineolata rhizophorae]
MLELHIWGPAFGLPSFDPECIAAVAYCRRALPAGSWILIANHDPYPSPSKDFPAIHDTESNTWAGGYGAILRHLRSRQAQATGAIDLDADLSSKQRADRAAYTTHVRSRALPLIDLALYTSYQNYSQATSAAFTALLPWHANYTIPPQRRAAARRRTAHLSLSGWDIDEEEEQEMERRHRDAGAAGKEYNAALEKATATGQRPSLLPLGRNRGILAALRRPEHAVQFKLDVLVTDFVEALDELLAAEGKDYLLSEPGAGSYGKELPSSLDCIALGYFSLLLFPDFPQPVVGDIVRSRYPRVSSYAVRLRGELLGKGRLSVDDVLALNELPQDLNTIEGFRAERRMHLPWSPLPGRSMGVVLRNISLEFLACFPTILSSITPAPIIRSTTSDSSAMIVRLPPPAAARSINYLVASGVGTMLLMGGAVIYGMKYRDRGPRDLIFFAQRPSGFARFGEAGAMLAALGRQMGPDLRV